LVGAAEQSRASPKSVEFYRILENRAFDNQYPDKLPSGTASFSFTPTTNVRVPHLSRSSRMVG
jgi:hypothetical protein